MKTHTTQQGWILAIALLIAGAAAAQGNRGRNGRDHDRGGRHYDHYENRDHDRGYNGHCDPYEKRYRDRDNSYYDYRGVNDRYDYPVVINRPAAPHFHRGRQPSRHHVWIPGEYRWNRGGYVYHPGYWAIPPRMGMQYIPGYWQPARNGGFVWISGFWNNGGFSVRL